MIASDFWMPERHGFHFFSISFYLIKCVIRDFKIILAIY